MKNKLIHKQFEWSGINDQGFKTTGEISAVTLNYARMKLVQQGITLTKLRKKPILFLKKTYKSISTLELSLFFRQFATLFISGIPIIQCCDILKQNQTNTAFKSVIETLRNDINSGKTLGRSLHKFPHYFDNLTCHLVALGEQTGTFAIMLTRIACHKEKIYFFKSKIKQAVFYPMIVTIIAVIVTVVMLTLVIPRFAELFQSMQKSLPAITLGVITISNWMRRYGWILGMLIFTIALLVYYFKKFLWLKHLFENLSIKIPLAKTILKQMILANVARNLAITFSAGLPIVDAINIIAPASGHNMYAKALLTLQAEISKGKQLHRAMQANALFPNMFIQMVRIGEETGKLEHMLEKIAELYENDADHFVTKLGHSLELLIMVFLGVLIGGLVIAMYMPIFKLGTVL